MENNDITRMIELLEEAGIRDVVTEGFDRWNNRRIRRRQSLRRTCLVMLLICGATAFAVALVPSIHHMVFPVAEQVDTITLTVLTSTAVTQPDTEPIIDTVPVVSIPQATPIKIEPESVVAVMPVPPRYSFLYGCTATDTMACFLLADSHSVAVACVAAASHFVVPEKVEHSGCEYAVTALVDSAFFSMTAIRSVTLPSSLVLVGKDAFSMCSGIDTLELLAMEPPMVTGEWCFFGMADTVRLVVPCGRATAYRNAPQWDGFEYVVDLCEPQQVILTEVTITVKGNVIVVEGADDETIDVYDSHGRLVTTTRCKGRCSLSIMSDNIDRYSLSAQPTGVYWVKVGSRPLRRVSLGVNHNTSHNNYLINYRNLEAPF